jgi:general secretion pathway protein M
MIATFRDNLFMRRTAFLTINLSACLVAYTLGVLPIRAVLAQREVQIDEQRQLLARLNAIAAQAQTVQGLLDTVDAAKEHAEFLRGSNPGVVAADLQTKLTALILSGGGRVRSIRSLPPKTVDGIKFLGAQIDISGPFRAIEQAVYSIENGTPFLFIAGATIKPSIQPSTFSGSAALTTEPTLDAQLDVIGALQPEGRD